MSFLGDIVDSIGSGKAPPPPNRSNSANTARPINNHGKIAPRPGIHPVPVASTGMKRKADDDINMTNTKSSRPNTPSEGTVKRTAAPPLHAPKPEQSKQSTPQIRQGDKGGAAPTSKPAPVAAANPPKPAPKGSYAEMMARVQQSAEQRMQSQVGTIRHQDTKKEKLARIAERRKMGQDKAKAPKTGGDPRKDGRKDIRRSTSPVKKDTTQPAKAAAAPSKPTYKGTMGIGASRSQHQDGRHEDRKRRKDEYLGTDEEDNSDMFDEDEEDYGSDVSSDMEAGYGDVEIEEAKALRAAKEADAEELALENEKRREKEERRKKLLGLANKQK